MLTTSAVSLPSEFSQFPVFDCLANALQAVQIVAADTMAGCQTTACQSADIIY